MLNLLFALLFIQVPSGDKPLTRNSYRAAARIALPSVVTITVKSVASYSADLEHQKEGGGTGTGSGIIVSADGLVVTNSHVIPEVVEALTVTLSDGRSFKAETVGKAKDTDIALIRIIGPPKDLIPAQLRDTADVSPGEPVIAIGAPLGLHNTVTHGVVSAIRPAKEDNPYPHGIIQTDAAINPGNSGGALADLDGRVIGMNTFIRSAAGGSIGLGFAIPADVVRTVSGQLSGSQTGGKGWVGLTVQDLDDSLRAAFGIPAAVNCILVTVVDAGSPAVSAGLKQSDCIATADGIAVSDASKLMWSIRNQPGGSTVTLELWSAKGPVRRVPITVKEKP